MPQGTRPIGDPMWRCGQFVLADIDQDLKLACELTGCPGPAFLRIDGVENSLKESNNPQSDQPRVGFYNKDCRLDHRITWRCETWCLHEVLLSALSGAVCEMFR